MEYSIVIDAPREKVWNILWADETYRAWTAPFSETSYAQTTWEKGSKVLFLDGKKSGMVSKIADNVPNEYMSIIHQGIVIDGVEDTSSAEATQWAGSYENYILKNTAGGTELRVEMGGAVIPDEFEQYFKDAWPKALAKVKELSEKN